MISKKMSLYDRDEKGNLLPLEVSVEVDETDEEQLKYKDEKIKVIPISRGKLKRLFAEVGDKIDEDKDFDGDIVGDHCIDPKFEKDEIKHIKPVLVSIIVNTIFRESGLKTGKNRKKALQEAEDEFAKN